MGDSPMTIALRAAIASKDAALTASEAEIARIKLHLSAWEDSARINKDRAERVEAEVERLTKALEPFANYIAGAKGLADHVTISNGSRFARLQLTVGDCRTAARALDRSPSVEPGNG